ncbi:hypothetical protein LTR85_010694 [Meristemomyces frigidus]|nr:hypothetical protein LTR85_010694 [Meristemomyces frigidus]
MDDIRTATSDTFNFNTRPVAIRVGRSYAPPFYVHPNVLRATSEFFREQIPINGHKHEQLVELPNADPAIFSAYLHFHYFGTIPCHRPNVEPSESTDGSGYSEYAVLCDLYLFAESVRDPQVMNAALGALMACYNEADPHTGRRLPEFETVSEVYRKSNHGSLLRRLLYDYADCLFFTDLTRALLRKGGKDGSNGERIAPGVTICEYHKPGDCEACVGRKRKRSDEEHRRWSGSG